MKSRSGRKTFTTRDGKALKGTSILFRFRDSVWPDIYPEVAITLTYSLFVALFHVLFIEVPTQDTTFITIFGLVIGLLLVFRTNTGYERYGEGRRAWGLMNHHVRTLTRVFTVGVKNCSTQDLVDKRSATNLLIAFAIALKHHLRKEYSYDNDKELHQKISHLPRVWVPKTKMEEIAEKSSQNQMEGKSSGGSEFSISVETLEGTVDSTGKSTESIWKLGSKDRKEKKEGNDGKKEEGRNQSMKAHDLVTPTNIPLELIYYLHTYVVKVNEAGKFNDPNTQRMSLEALNGLQLSLSDLERIRRTPIPLAYSIHLHQTIWFYLLALPWQLVGKMGWIAIPATGLVTFAFVGILAIGTQIENPFGYDDNDLPLDDYCAVLQEEVNKIVRRPFPSANDWIETKENHPLGPQFDGSASELGNLSVEEFWEISDGKGKAREFVPNEEMS